MPSVATLRSRPPRPSAVPGPTFNSLVLKPLHLNSLRRYQENYYKEEEEEKEKERNESKRQNTGNNNVHHHAHINDVRFQKANSQKALLQPTRNDSEKHRKRYLYGPPDPNQNRHHNLHSSYQDRTHLHHLHQQQQQQHKSTATLLSQGSTMTKAHQTAERMKDSRLKGADLYVARLGRAGKANISRHSSRNDERLSTDEIGDIADNIERRASNFRPASTPKPLTGSLHEELRFPSPSENKRPTPQSVSTSERVTATCSRPCYRCISYMHSAGIKRVFWTNHRGEWEGGKVRDLVDALEGSLPPDRCSSAGPSATSPVYVTKSEVLLLKGLK